jgi:glycosyltransferase involved in cell wall biosynthesis
VAKAVVGRVTVVMPCYNGERFVAEAIESVLAQTYADIELIVVDDGSTDGSLTVVRGYGDKVRCLTQANQGPSAARNHGIFSATGEYVAFLDADDYWEPRFVEVMVAALRQSNATLAYCGWQNVYMEGSSPPPFIPPEYENQNKRITLLSNASLWPIHAMLTPRDALLDIGAFDVNLPACEDYDLWLKLTFTKPIVRVPEVFAYYRHHKALADTDKRGSDAVYLFNIKKAFVAAHPSWVSDLSADTLRDCIDGGLMRRGYQCYWRRELKSARLVFRTALRERASTVKDLKYVLPALLPEPLYLALFGRIDKH